MAFFIQLISIWGLLWLVSQFAFKTQLRSHALKGRIAFSFGFTFVGVMHLIKPAGLAYMIEGMLAYPLLWVYLTGVIEIGLAVMLLIPKYQKITGWLIIIYLLLIFPANINVAIRQLPAPGSLPSEPWYLWSRLLFQPVYMFWVYLAAIKPLTGVRVHPRYATE